MNRCIFGDCRDGMRELIAQGVKVQCVVTSPPYFGLRDYGTAQWEGGEEGCDHVADAGKTKKFGNPEFNKNAPSREATKTKGYYYGDICGKCGARRIDKQLGLEATPDCGRHIARLRSDLTEKQRHAVLERLKELGLV